MSTVHPSSKYQESARDDELTLWEVNRKPRKLVTENRRIRVPVKMLNPQFRCVICLGYIKETTMVMECLHRFCHECIHKCIRIGMKECPNCRKFIPSRRSLKRDYRFDELICRMIGTVSDRQLNEDSNKMEADKMVHLQKAISRKKDFVDRQKIAGTATPTHPLAISNRGDKPLASSAGPPIENFQESPLMEIELRRHPQEVEVDRLERSFLTLRGDAKVNTLKTFLSQKLEEREYEISSKLDDESVVLDNDLTLFDAKEVLCRESNAVLVLTFKVASTDPGRPGKPKEDGSDPSKPCNNIII